MTAMKQPVDIHQPPSFKERITDLVTAFCGNMVFVYVHAAAFAVWIPTEGRGG